MALQNAGHALRSHGSLQVAEVLATTSRQAAGKALQQTW